MYDYDFDYNKILVMNKDFSLPEILAPSAYEFFLSLLRSFKFSYKGNTFSFWHIWIASNHCCWTLEPVWNKTYELFISLLKFSQLKLWIQVVGAGLHSDLAPDNWSLWEVSTWFGTKKSLIYDKHQIQNNFNEILLRYRCAINFLSTTDGLIPLLIQKYTVKHLNIKWYLNLSISWQQVILYLMIV